MKNFLVLFLVLFTIVLHAQKENIDAKIIFKDGTEQNSKIKFRVNMFWSDLIDESSVAFKDVLVMDQNGKLIKTPSSLIQRIEFIDLKNKKRVFASRPEYKYLVEMLFEGKKLQWVRYYNIHSYDGSTQQTDYFHKPKMKTVALGVFSNNRKKLKELTGDRPDLIPLIEKINFDKLKEEALIEILQKYEEV